MNRTLKEATVRRNHYATDQQLQEHLAAFLDAYNFAMRLKSLNGLTPYEAISNAWADQPSRFLRDPTQLNGTEHCCAAAALRSHAQGGEKKCCRIALPPELCGSQMRMIESRGEVG